MITSHITQSHFFAPRKIFCRKNVFPMWEKTNEEKGRKKGKKGEKNGYIINRNFFCINTKNNI